MRSFWHESCRQKEWDDCRRETGIIFVRKRIDNESENHVSDGKKLRSGGIG